MTVTDALYATGPEIAAASERFGFAFVNAYMGVAERLMIDESVSPAAMVLGSLSAHATGSASAIGSALSICGLNDPDQRLLVQEALIHETVRLMREALANAPVAQAVRQ